MALSTASTFADDPPGTPSARGPRVGEAIRAAAERLRAAGCESPRLDAELLLAEALGVDRAGLLSASRDALDFHAERSFAALLARRARREPVAYILGRKPFRHLEVQVDHRVLVPRPETELLVEAALGLPPGARVVDVGTGSGAVALALKHERPDLEVVAADLSADALAVAAANARRLGLEIDLRHSDLLAGVAGPLDAVVANLPYVAEPDWPTLPPEITAHEPRSALTAGRDGLELIRRLIGQAAAVPWLALEVGAGQAPAVAEQMRAAGRPAPQTYSDLAGIERVVAARTA